MAIQAQRSASIWNSNDEDSVNSQLLRRYSLRSPSNSFSGNSPLSFVLDVGLQQQQQQNNNHLNNLQDNNNNLQSSLQFNLQNTTNSNINIKNNINDDQQHRTSPSIVTSSVSSQQPNSGRVSSFNWEMSADNKYLIGYISITREQLDQYRSGMGGIQLSCGRPAIPSPSRDHHHHQNNHAIQQQQLGTIVEHVVPGSLMNIMCKLKVGDEIVEINGVQLRNKNDVEIRQILEGVKLSNSLRMVAIRMLANNNKNEGKCPRQKVEQTGHDHQYQKSARLV